MNNYLDVLKKGITNIPNIAEGWINVLKSKYDILSEDKKIVAQERISKCLECPFNSVNAITLGYTTGLDYFHCSSCLCPIDVKVYAFNEACGLGHFMFHAQEKDQEHILKYYQDHPLESIDLKWKAYTKE